MTYDKFEFSRVSRAYRKIVAAVLLRLDRSGAEEPAVRSPLRIFMVSAMPSFNLHLPHLVALALLLGATYHDLRRYRIPNALTYPATLLGLAFAFLALLLPTAWRSDAWVLAQISPLTALAGATLGLATMGVVWSLTGHGGGDVKLAAALGALYGPWALLHILALAFLLAAGFALARLVWDVGPRRLASHAIRASASWVAGNMALGWASTVTPPEALPRDVVHRAIPLAGFFAVATFLTVGAY